MDKVLEGAWNNIQMEFGTLPEDEKKEILRRRLICDTCPFMSSNAVTNPALNYKTTRFDNHCVMCGCNIKLKTGALDEACGIETFNSLNPDKALPLKWDVYKNQTNEHQTD